MTSIEEDERDRAKPKEIGKGIKGKSYDNKNKRCFSNQLNICICICMYVYR